MRRSALLTAIAQPPGKAAQTCGEKTCDQNEPVFYFRQPRLSASDGCEFEQPKPQG
jgi:hypothetical protein